MYASNEDEDWIYLHKTPPVNSVLQKVMNFADCEHSSSSKSDRSISLSSISSNEFEHTQTDDVLLSSTHDSMDNDLLLSQQLISTPTVNEKEDLSSDIIILQDNPSIETSVAMNENDILNTGFELSNESLSLSSNLRHRTGVNVQQTDLNNSEITQPISISQDIKPRKRFERHQNKNDILVSCTCLIVFLSLSFILGQIVTQWDQHTMNTITKELIKTNQRLNEIQDFPNGNFEEKLTKNLEDKIQNIINEKLTWYKQETSLFISHIHGLQKILNKTRQNLTDTIHQLTHENHRLQEQIKLLEHRLELAEEQNPQNKKKSSRLTFNKLFSNIFKKTASVATDTSVNLSGIFERLSASVSNIIDHRKHTRSSITEQFRKIKSRQSRKFPWRWTFHRSYNRASIHHQEHICYSKFSFPLNKICSMKNWMIKLFR